MVTKKQLVEDFKSEQKALKTEMKAAKKDAGNAKKVIRKNTKLISKKEREIGHCYYQEQQRPTADGKRKLEHCCTLISRAEREIAESTERLTVCNQRVLGIRQDLKNRKKAFKAGTLGEITLETP